MNYIYILTYLGGCVNGICVKMCLCSDKIKIDSDDDDSNEEDNRWYNSRSYINYLENILHNLTPTRRSAIPFEFPETNNTIDQVSVNAESLDNSVSPSAPPLAEASIIRD
tara:strand:- start:386 stop:715 length:330 start_codon:yes stop_codon:yes gene_type:complete